MTAQVARLRLTIEPEPAAQVASVAVVIPASTAQIASVGLTAIGDILVVLSAATREGSEVESQDTVTLTAITNLTGTVVFERTDTDPKAVPLTGTDKVRTFKAPAGLAGYAFGFRARVDLGAGSFSAWSNVANVLVRPHQLYYRANGVLVPIRLERKGGTPGP